MAIIQVNVSEITPISEYVYRVVLESEQTLPSFRAGQYLKVIMSDEDARPFSIANPPYQHDFLELHIGASEHNPYAMEVIEKLKNEKQISVEMPCGDAVIQNDAEDSILIAGGTGYSYTRSLLLQKLHANKGAKVCLYWGAKTESDLYEMDSLLQLQAAHSDFSFVPVIENSASDWSGRTGLVHEAVLTDYQAFDKQHVYLAGRFEMAKVVRDEFIPRGIQTEQLIGDAFAYID